MKRKESGMLAATVKFNVGGTVFEVAVSTIKSRPEGLLAKMIDGRFECGLDESGAYFVDRDARFFGIVLAVHRDNKVYSLSPGMTREGVLAELEFYGLEDFEGVPMHRSVEATLLSVGGLRDDFVKWQQDQEILGEKMLCEALARLTVARAKLSKTPGSTTLEISGDNLTWLEAAQKCEWHTEAPIDFKAHMKEGETNCVEKVIPEIFAEWNIKATWSRNLIYPENPGSRHSYDATDQGEIPTAWIKLEPAEPAGGV
ncbi:hypothetical protein T484DRAFT_1796014 [Baffinella frigidus]|nr:hypothetical protein T484DRAFT_1796014 [Cryptophyta sp. CCMP2293]